MAFPVFVHAVNSATGDAAWPVEGQGWNECGCTAASNAANLLAQAQRYRKDDFVREAGVFFQPQWGGTPSPVTTWLLKRHGFGTHFGNLQRTDYEAVLRDLIDRGVPVIIELGMVKMGSVAVSGQHSVVLVGYSEPFHDQSGQLREEYYIVDAQWPALGQFSLASNNRDFNGDSVVEEFPGNRTLTRAELSIAYPMRTYFPVFATQADHDAWYSRHIGVDSGFPLFGGLAGQFVTGSRDIWLGTQGQAEPLPSA